ncbi:sensor histidine kinase [Corynebacterium incognita]|uniref:histidine kinase n=1 Tax=Corynebacterium incognita TaxID=2754725 RepID=A0A7G7CMP8_9CORY|nr:sensor histidine kinase [Corynebacterium incognita]QNE88864.1 sensor histidine kinase [Corynebacterium incognita]
MTPTRASATESAAAPTRYWPSGFSRNPLRLLRRRQHWRVMAWSFVLALLCIPTVVVSLVLLAWVPWVARVVDNVAVSGASFVGVSCAERRAIKIFDGPQALNLLAHIILMLLALIAWTVALIVFVVWMATPILAVTDPDFSANFGNYRTNNIGIICALCLPSAAILVTIHSYFCWLITGASTAATVAAHGANAHKVQELESSRATIIDAFSGERRRIERELHDGVQQYLTAVQLNIAAAQLHAANNPEHMADSLEQARQNSNKALEALRSTVRGIYPQVLQDHGLVEAINELVHSSGLAGDVEVDAAAETNALTDTQALLLYHAVSEALTNASKHGHASHVLVRVHGRSRDYSNDKSTSAITVTISDDGTGPDLQRSVAASPSQPAVPDLNAEQSSGTGIAGLRERARSLGGDVEFGSSNEFSGAQLTISLPQKGAR